MIICPGALPGMLEFRGKLQREASRPNQEEFIFTKHSITVFIVCVSGFVMAQQVTVIDPVLVTVNSYSSLPQMSLGKPNLHIEKKRMRLVLLLPHAMHIN